VIVHSPGHQALSDWTTVRDLIHERAPDIEVRIADNSIPSSTTRRWQTRRPSLVFSPSPLIRFEPAGGRVYAGRRLHKLDAFQRLSEAGIPTPDSAPFIMGIPLSPRRWGEFVVLKPPGLMSSYGRFVRLVRTGAAASRFDELKLDRTVEMMAQQFIDARDAEGRIFEVRVMTMFGSPMYALKATLLEQRAEPAAIADGDGEIAANRKGPERELKLDAEEDVIALARRAAAAFPDVPCLGLDIVRDHASGALLVLEVNGASVWHLSSRSTPNYPQEVRDGIYNQFGAIETATGRLIEKVRAEAV
jgi:hypothetical protein